MANTLFPGTVTVFGTVLFTAQDLAYLTGPGGVQVMPVSAVALGAEAQGPERSLQAGRAIRARRVPPPTRVRSARPPAPSYQQAEILPFSLAA